ncbi:hypothetical protein TPY_0482 [Sulfobacillus acidophilus TPY]|nr:hypothetical protein TPY_0482 [Sulfobacillus acidophilus TPY]
MTAVNDYSRQNFGVKPSGRWFTRKVGRGILSARAITTSGVFGVLAL